VVGQSNAATGPAGSQVSPPDPEFGHPVVSLEALAGFFLSGPGYSGAGQSSPSAWPIS
jgi:hypothetical protein